MIPEGNPIMFHLSNAAQLWFEISFWGSEVQRQNRARQKRATGKKLKKERVKERERERDREAKRARQASKRQARQEKQASGTRRSRAGGRLLSWTVQAADVKGPTSLSITAKQKVPRGFEPRSLDSGSRVLTVTPRDQMTFVSCRAVLQQYGAPQHKKASEAIRRPGSGEDGGEEPRMDASRYGTMERVGLAFARKPRRMAKQLRSLPLQRPQKQKRRCPYGMRAPRALLAQWLERWFYEP